MQVFGAGSSAWYTDACQAVERSVRIGVPAWDDRKAAGSNPARSTTKRIDPTRRLARSAYPLGGSRIVNKKRKTNLYAALPCANLDLAGVGILLVWAVQVLLVQR